MKKAYHYCAELQLKPSEVYKADGLTFQDKTPFEDGFLSGIRCEIADIFGNHFDRKIEKCKVTIVSLTLIG